MATLLVHIQVKPGREAAFEAVAAELYRETHAHDTGCLRYEYWRGAERGYYYSLLVFEDFHAFLRHQLSDHHERRAPEIVALCEGLKLEWLDPIANASPLPATAMQPVPDDADEKTTRYHALFAATLQDWWPARGR